MNEEINDWSPTHIRLRAELFFIAVLIAALNWFEVDLTKLPLGITLKTAPPSHLLLVPLYLIFFYFSMALWFRTQRERIQHASPKALFEQFLSDLEDRMERIAYSFDPEKSQLDTGLAGLQSIRKNLVQDLENARATQQYLAQTIPAPFVVEAVDEMGHPNVYPVNDELRRKILVELGFKEGHDNLNLLSDNLVRMMASISSSMERVDNSVRQMEVNTQAQLEAFSGDLNVAVGSIEMARQSVDDKIELLEKSNKAAQRQLRTDILALRRGVETMRTVVGVEQNLFGFWLPFSTSVFVAVSYPAYMTYLRAIELYGTGATPPP